LKKMTTNLFTLLQLADGTFPSGGFAHSGGLEAMSVLGPPFPLADFLETSLRHVARAVLPFVLRAAKDPGELAMIDDAFDATLPLLFINQASRAQGRALASAAQRVWSLAALTGATGPMHHGPVFGAIFGSVSISPEETAAAYLHGYARGITSAAVRLGLFGPLEAQRLIADHGPLFESLRAEALSLDIEEDAAQAAPVLEIFAALHDRLDGRMFQS